MVSKVTDFLTDNDFIDYVLGVSPGLASQWEAYFEIHPGDKNDAEEAKTILLAPTDVDSNFSTDERYDLKGRIISSIKGFQDTIIDLR